MIPALQSRRSGGGAVREEREGFWRLDLPSGKGGAYRWAQMDDYMHLRRASFPWRAPQRFELRARVSAPDLPGTWGFGFWNDPFNASLGIGGTSTRLPALPNTAWFFYASPANYLAFGDGHPAQGFLAATFSAPRIPPLLMAPGALALPLLPLRPAARLLRRMAAGVIKEDAAIIPGDPTEWRTYRLDWQEERVIFFVNGSRVFSTPVSPRGPLGLVLWIDNQYVAFPPSGRLQMGTLPNEQPAWLELEGIDIA